MTFSKRITGLRVAERDQRGATVELAVVARDQVGEAVPTSPSGGGRRLGTGRGQGADEHDADRRRGRDEPLVTEIVHDTPRMCLTRR